LAMLWTFVSHTPYATLLLQCVESL
jgi:hypothetical protein